MSDGVIRSQIRHALHRLLFTYLKWLFWVLMAIYLVKGVPGKNTGMFYVDRDEIAVSQYLGRIHDSNVQPGVHYIAPWPLGRVDKVPIKQMKTVVVDSFASKIENTDQAADPTDPGAKFEPYCITGDNNIVRTTMLIKYTITNPVDYLFRGLKTAENESFIKNIAASAIVHNLLILPVDDILTIRKNEIEMAVKSKLQSQLDFLKAGIGISFVEIKEINPPLKIQPFFNDVINAKVDRQKMVHEGNSYRNMIIPEARSNAGEMIRAAQSYKNEQILHAQGLTARFLSRLSESDAAQQINREKLYLDTMSQIFPKLGEVRVVTPAAEKAGSDQHDTDSSKGKK